MPAWRPAWTRRCLLEANHFGLLSATDDMQEGTKAFVEKRKPAFKGRMSLQISRATDYFLTMLKIGRGGWRAGFLPRLGPLKTASLLLLPTGCDDRERLTFPTPSDGVGPVTTIEQPDGADTTIFPGGLFSVQGRTVDPDGVDTVYFLVNGGEQSFPAFVPSQLQTTVTFSPPPRDVRAFRADVRGAGLRR